MLNYRQRRLWLSSFKRALRWEFWPLWLFYIPIVFYIIGLVIRYRGLAFTAVNPGMRGSGVIGESKSETLLELQEKLPGKVAFTAVISAHLSPDQRQQQSLSIMASQQWDFPVVLKPDAGQRGAGVAIIHDQAAMAAYLADTTVDSILQPYIAGVEFGIFYYRFPDAANGHVFSLTHKCFPSVTGDGRSTLEQLILEHPRLHYMARFLLRLHREKLSTVPAVAEEVKVVRLGSHCRGSLFLDGGQYLTPAISEAIDHISRLLSGFYFGRYDIRAASIDAFQRGDFQVIEVNGVTSESTNIYDPANSLLKAYEIMWHQWRLAFAIGDNNRQRGYRPLTVLGFLSLLKPTPTA